MLQIFTRVAKKSKRSGTFMAENVVDSPYLFLDRVSHIVASLVHPRKITYQVEEKKKNVM